MASLRKRIRGKSLMFEIDFYVDGRRKTIPLGKKYTEKTARELLEVVESLLHCRANNIEVPGKRTVVWVESASPEIRSKLGKAGLIEIPPTHTLKETWDTFLTWKAKGVKESTVSHYVQVRKRFFLFFREDDDLASLTKDRMQEWKDCLLKEMATAATASYIKGTKACFKTAG